MTTLATHTTGANSPVNGTISIPAVAANVNTTAVRTQFDITNHTGSSSVSVNFGFDVSFDGGVTWNAGKTDGQPWGFAARAAGSAPPSRVVQYTGSISGTTLTASGVTGGKLQPGMLVVGATALAVAQGTYITDDGAGGGDGTYPINISQNVSSQAMSSGVGGMSWCRHQLPSDGQGNLNRMIRASLTTNGSLVTSLQLVELG